MAVDKIIEEYIRTHPGSQKYMNGQRRSLLPMVPLMLLVSLTLLGPT
jgi:hypothetical protein